MAEALFDKEVERMRLNHTLCLYDKKAVFVDTEDTMPGYVTISQKGKANEVIPITDPKFKYNDIKLGYCNIGQFVTYLTRRPERKFASGLRMGVVNSSRPVVMQPRDVNLFSESVCNMIENNYPTLERALFLVESNKNKAVAFHRWFCFEKDDRANVINLLWKENICGTYDLERQQVNWIVNPYMSLIQRVIARNSFNLR